MIGKVNWFNSDKGFGFASSDDISDIFIHYSVIRQKGYKFLSKDQIISFDLSHSSKGYKAENVIVVKDVIA